MSLWNSELESQITSLLHAKALTCDQLASCYFIKYGKSITQPTSDVNETLESFLQKSPVFWIHNGKVSVASVSHGRNPPTVPPERQSANPQEYTDSAIQLKYADVSRGLQNIFKEKKRGLSVAEVEATFAAKFHNSIPEVVGMPTLEYLQRKENIFSYCEDTQEVYLQPNLLAGPPIPDPGAHKDERFVVREFASLIEDSGPVCYISSLCGKFIQRNGVSVTSITSSRPLDLFKRHADTFLLVGGGNVTLRKFENHPQVQKMMHGGLSKAQRMARTTEEAQIPIPEVITEADVVREFRRLILQDSTDVVYISSLCGRFLQRFKIPVTNVIDSRPADFLRKYDDVFVMTGGGNVGLREVLGDDVKSVPPPPPREQRPKLPSSPLMQEELELIDITDEIVDLISACPPRLQQQAEKVVSELCQLMLGGSFLAVESLEIGGSAGKNLVFHDCLDFDIVVFVRQLPFIGHKRWQHHVLETLEVVLLISLKEAKGFKSDDFHLRFFLNDISVSIYISPVFRSDKHRLDCIASTPPAERYFYAPSMIRENLAFIGKQSPSVKTVLKLMRWWKRQQRWSAPLYTPSDELIELIVIHASLKLGPIGTDLSTSEIIEEVITVMQKFEDIRVLWADHGLAKFSLQDIWHPLLSQAPLFMHPVNPYLNMAEPSIFDCKELVQFSQKPGVLYAFRRQASRIPQVFENLRNACQESKDDGDDDDESVIV
eukprot:GEMP01012282.1.p1 GENE.GEMP01012282.1~~GEMP01012282.1.p1  ORF type:complete len:716 (+),score=125.82 GEMP01012282.1:159-2306(+)